MANEIEVKDATVLGQKYAFATASLIVGISCFVSLLGLEKAIVAIIFAWLALRKKPEPVLKEHRTWAKIGLILGILPLILLPLIIILFFDQLSEILDVLSKLEGSK